nr:hypothetical protein [Tanacetum cinerariifolium]
MGDEHLGTILATGSDEVIKSSVEDLVPIPREISSGSTTTHFDISLLDYEAFYFDNDHVKEISSGSPTTQSDISLSEYDSFIFDLTHEEFVDELTHIISPPEYDCFYFRNLPDSGELMSVLNSRIRENLSTTLVNSPIEDDYSPLLAYVNKYRWNPSIDVDVRRVFNKIGSKSFSDCMSKAKKKAEKPEFMNHLTWEALCEVWRLPAFVAKSDRGKTARQSNKRLHTGGSIPISEHKKNCEKNSQESLVFLNSSCGAIRTRRQRCLSTQQQKQHGKSSEHCAQTEFPQTEFPQSYTKSSEPFRALEGYTAVHGADDALDAHSGNGAKTFPKWIDRVGSNNGTTYGVGDVDEYVCQPNIKEPSAHDIPNVEIVQLVDLIKVQQVDHNLLKTEVNNLKNAQEAQSKKLDQVVKAQSSSEKRLRKFVVQEVGKLVANEVGKAVAEEVGKAT